MEASPQNPAPRPPRQEEPVCPDCLGSGWRVARDGGNGTASPCDCRLRNRSAQRLAQAAIPERYRDCRFASFYTNNQTADAATRDTLLRARRASELYVDRFLDAERGRFRTSGLLYLGPPGTGKTHLAVAVLTALIERYGVRGRFVNLTQLLYEIKLTFDPSTAESRRQVLAPVIAAELLVLDELGAAKPSEWVQETLYLIINERYTRSLPTLFTTNYRLEDGGQPAPAADTGEQVFSDAATAQDLARVQRGAPPGARAPNPHGNLAARISPVLVSRLYEMAQPVVVGNWDYRQKVMMPRRALGN